MVKNKTKNDYSIKIKNVRLEVQKFMLYAN